MERAADEQSRAALGYLFWPASLYEYYFEREPASHWYRAQVRQALRFGLISSIVGLAAVLWPLLTSVFAGNLTVTLIVYRVAFALDAALLGLWLVRARRYSKRAARGETFGLVREHPASTGNLGENR